MFSDLTGRLDPPVLVVTVAARGERSGCLVGFATQTSIDPVRYLACISRANHTCRIAAGADVVVVHVLAEDQRGLAELFGGETGDEVDKFARCAWSPGPGGAPVLDGCAGWFAGKVLERLDLGDHIGYLVEPIEAWKGEEVRPLGFQRVRDIEAGHEA